jgi:hypothetical protein
VRVYVRKLVVRQRLRFFPASLPFPFVNGRSAAGGHRVNTLIRRGLREDAKSGLLTPRLRHRVFVRRTSGACPVLPDAFSSRLRGDRNRAIPKREEGTGAGSQPVKPRSAKSAERLAAALRSGALTDRAPTPVKALPLCSECLSLPQRGKLFKAAMRVPRRTNWHPSDPNKSILADVREQIVVCAQLSCMTSRSSTGKPDELLVMLDANSGCSYTGEGTTFPFGFPRRSRRSIAATLAALFSPSSNRCCDLV